MFDFSGLSFEPLRDGKFLYITAIENKVREQISVAHDNNLKFIVSFQPL